MPDLKAHFFGNQLRHGKKAGQQNNQHGDPIISTGYFVASELEAVLAVTSLFTHNNRILITSGTGPTAREWRGRLIVRAAISNQGTAEFAVYIFVVAPYKDSPGLEVEVAEGGRLGDPENVTITVTNGAPTPATTTATAAPTQVPID